MKLRFKAACSVVFLLILLIAAPSQAQYNDTVIRYDGFETAYRVFGNAGIEIKDIKLQGWGRISNSLYSTKQLETAYQTIAQGLGLEGKPAIQAEKDGFAGISRLGESNGETWQFSLQAIPLDGNTGETYLAFLFTAKDRPRARQVYDQLLPLLREIGFQEQVGITFTGVMSGLVDPGIRLALVRELAGAVKADYIEGIVEERFTSLSFYTTLCTEYLIVGDIKINLNIAVCNDEVAGLTYVHVGVPLIYQDY